MDQSWDMSASSAHTFPQAEADRLENEQNYYVWSVRMQNAFESCEMWGVVNGSETIPPDDKDHAIQHRIWKKKDSLAKAMITQCIKADLISRLLTLNALRNHGTYSLQSSVRPAQVL